MQYEVYHFSKGHIVKLVALHSEDDDEAIATARCFGSDVEVWQRFRLVARVDSKGNVLPLRE
jgi:hypothetical protein